MAAESYLVNCWSCLGEYDALTAVWCSDDPKNPTKLCPFCFQCFCEASAGYRSDFWRRAPARLQEELATLHKSRDRLGEILIRMRKITTPQLLDVLNEQREGGQRLGELLVSRGLVSAEDVEAALRTQGGGAADVGVVVEAAGNVWEQGDPEVVVDYVLELAARKGASDVQIEPREDGIGIKYRIDGFFFRVDPIPSRFRDAVTRAIYRTFDLEEGDDALPRTGRVRTRLADREYDVVVQTLPTPYGLSASVKLINRETFIKDLSGLGLEVEDRVRLIEELGASSGLVLVTGPLFNGATTTTYSLMTFLARGERDLVSIESPSLWQVSGVRQVEVEAGPGRIEESLRSMASVKPEVVVLTAVPDRATAALGVQLAGSLVVVAQLSANSAAQAVRALVTLGVSPEQVGGCLRAVSCQRLVRQICRSCRQPAEPPAPERLARHGISAKEAAGLRVFRGQGCAECNKVGYRGRRGIFEVLTGSQDVKVAAGNGLSAAEIEAVGVATGMTTLRERCLALVRAGITTFEEFARLRL